MARIVASSFAGVPASVVDVGSPTFTSVVRKAIGVTALVYDKATGQNGAEAAGITTRHTGAPGRGARLGVPWFNVCFSGRDAREGQYGIDLAYTNAPSSSKADGTFASDTVVFGAPLYVPEGEPSFECWIFGAGLHLWPWRLKIVDAANFATVYFDRQFEVRDGGSVLFVSGNNVPNLPSPLGLRILLIQADTTARQQAGGSTPDGQVLVYAACMGPMRIRNGGASSPPMRGSNDIGVPAPGSAPINFRDIEDTMVQDDSCLHAYTLSVTNRNQNALYEYLTGWPAGGNPNYTHADSGSINPTTSRFFAHTRAGFANEPEVAWPLMVDFFGAFCLDGSLVVQAATPPTFGMLDWYAPIPIATAATTHFRWQLRIPDFVANTNSRLKAAILCGTDNSAHATQWSGSWSIGGNLSAANAFAVVPGSNNKIVLCKHNLNTLSTNFAADTLNTVELRLQKSTAKNSVDELVLIGACLYFDPP